MSEADRVNDRVGLLNERAGRIFDSFFERFDNLIFGCLFAFTGVLCVALVLLVFALIFFPRPADDRTCVHRTPVLVGKVTTFVCDTWGTASPTDRRP